MARITVQDVYNGAKYDVMSAAVADYLKNGRPTEYDERTWMDMLLVKHTLIAAEKMNKEGDSISAMFDGESPSSYNEYMIFTIHESTWDSYASMIRMHVKPCLGDKPVAFITTADVQRMYNKIKKNGRQEAHPLRGHELADSTVRSVHVMLHEAMDAAARERLIVKNPTDGTTIPKNNYAPKQILTEAQLEKFMRVVMQDEVWRDFFYTELTTGLRLGEICGLRWSDFDEATGRLKISRTVKKKKGGGEH